MVTNSSGQIAMKYNQTIPHVVRVGGTDYVFVVQHNISLAWINSEHTASVQAIHRKNCCGSGHRSSEYHFASEQDVQLWSGGSR